MWRIASRILAWATATAAPLRSAALGFHLPSPSVVPTVTHPLRESGRTGRAPLVECAFLEPTEGAGLPDSPPEAVAVISLRERSPKRSDRATRRPDMPHCQALTKKKKPCPNETEFAFDGKFLCHIHNPNLVFRKQVEARRERTRELKSRKTR